MILNSIFFIDETVARNDCDEVDVNKYNVVQKSPKVVNMILNILYYSIKYILVILSIHGQTSDCLEKYYKNRRLYDC